MIKFKKDNNKVILSYSSDQSSAEWVYHELETVGTVSIGKAFTLTPNELMTTFDYDNEHDAVEFEVATKIGEYYNFPKGLLSLTHDLFIHNTAIIDRAFFVAERGISVFPKIDNMVQNSIYIGGGKEGAIPLSVYIKLLKAFPNSYELNRYASARISSVLSSYIDTKEDYEAKYQNYLNKKVSKKGENLKYRFSELEVIKYTSILKKLNTMLNYETSYSEAQWQEELLQIILLRELAAA